MHDQITQEANDIDRLNKCLTQSPKHSLHATQQHIKHQHAKNGAAINNAIRAI